MGEVFLAERQTSAGVPVRCVVKTLLESIAADPFIRELFLDEARTCAHLSHPNVVSITDVGRAADRLYIAMEWIDGLDASRLLDRAATTGREIPLKHVLFIAREALKGLHHAHTARDQQGRGLGIIHRDISPGNILISRQGGVKLADFGVAMGKATRSPDSEKLIVGKPQYHAPELYAGEQASARTDIFAFGVAFFELVSSRRLFDPGRSRQELAAEVRAFDPAQLLEHDLTLPDALEPILLAALAPDPAKRYATALEFLEDVNDFAYEAGIRLLDAHFARYIEKALAAMAAEGGVAR